MEEESPIPDPNRQHRIEELQRKLEASERFERLEKRDKRLLSVKLVASGLAALVVLSGGVWGFTKLADLTPDNPCGFHEHATFRVFARGEQLSFVHPRFDMRNMAMKAHLHQPNDNTVHLEGGCASVTNFFSLIGMTLKPGYLKLDKELHGGMVLEDDGNETLRFFLYQPKVDNGTWAEKPDIPGHQLRDGQRLLVTYGNLTQESIARQQSAVPLPPESG